MLVMSANMFTVPPPVNAFSPEAADTNPNINNPNPKSNTTTTTTTNASGKKKRNLPGNPGKRASHDFSKPSILIYLSN